MSEHSSQALWKSFTAGALASATARCCVAPLDLVKIRMQIHQQRLPNTFSTLTHITQTEGVSALWKGNLAALGMVVPYSAIQFAVYAQVQRWVKHALNPPESALFSGAVAGIVATLFTYPMDLVRTCQAASSQRVLSTKEVVSHAVSSRSLYRGSLVTILGIIPYAAMQFSVYEQAKHWFGHSSQALLISGILAGVCGKIANMPFDVIKKRMQIEGILYSSGHSRIWQFSKSILEKEGIMAFFKGTAPSVIKAAPNSAITFFVYERVMDLLEQI